MVKNMVDLNQIQSDSFFFFVGCILVWFHTGHNQMHIGWGACRAENLLVQPSFTGQNYAEEKDSVYEPESNDSFDSFALLVCFHTARNRMNVNWSGCTGENVLLKL